MTLPTPPPAPVNRRYADEFVADVDVLAAGGLTDPDGKLDESAVVEHLKPGDLIFGRGTAESSQVIAKMTGVWSHVAIYIGCAEGPDESRKSPDRIDTRPMVVECRGLGPVQNGLEFLANEMYAKEGLGWARLKDSRNADELVDWALNEWTDHKPDRQELLKDKNYASLRSYNKDDLIHAFDILFRAAARNIGKLAILNDEQIRKMGEDLGLLAEGRKAVHKKRTKGLGQMPHSWTCAGFVYVAIKSAGVDLHPSFLHGVLQSHDGSWLFDQSDSAKTQPMPLGLAMEEFHQATTDKKRKEIAHSRFEMKEISDAGLATLTAWAKAIVQILPHLPALRHLGQRTGMAPARIVSPTDIWASPDLESRMFLTQHSKERSESFLADFSDSMFSNFFGTPSAEPTRNPGVE